MSFFTLAFAADAQAAPAGGLGALMNMAPIAILIVIFYFLLIRPQQKRAKEHKEMLNQMQKGDTVVTNGGLYGRVYAVSEDTVTLEVAENVRVKVAKDAVSMRKPQG